MSASRHRSRRPVLAGLGVAGSLVAAVSAAAIITTGIVAFDRWPGPPAGGQGGAVRLEPPRGPRSGWPATALGRGTRTASARQLAVPVVRTSRRPGRDTARVQAPRSSAGPVTATTPSATSSHGAATPVSKNPLTARRDGIAGGVDGAGDAVGDRVAGFGSTGGEALGRVSPPLGGAVRGTAGTGAAEARTVSQAAADLLRRLPGG
jgi:hypothetical protein